MVEVGLGKWGLYKVGLQPLPHPPLTPPSGACPCVALAALLPHLLLQGANASSGLVPLILEKLRLNQEITSPVIYHETRGNKHNPMKRIKTTCAKNKCPDNGRNHLDLSAAQSLVPGS